MSIVDQSQPKQTVFLFIMVVLFGISCRQDIPNEFQEVYNSLPEKVDFNFHIKPILSDRCFACHGPDKNTRKAGLRLDLEEEAFKELKSGGSPFFPGNIGKSVCIERMMSKNPAYQMPPPESNLTLEPKEIAMIMKWVEDGAEWKPHWAFIPPEKAEIPHQFPEAWNPNNEIDHFIYEKLKDNDINPSVIADKEQLIRRVTMDLTGLPPSMNEINDFLEDTTPGAYEKVVNRLIGSDAYAERLAMEWMDVSRYADSHGLHADGSRYMWPWRDWVIETFKKNMPYDQFVTWQLAGDLIPNASKEQILATAFHRNHAMTAEGGVIDEEFRVEYVADRTNTTATAFLGLTMECARCHDHKFDPISQKEYYQMSSFFNNVKELGMTGDDGVFGPLLMMTTEEEDASIEAIKELITKKEKELSNVQTGSGSSELRPLGENAGTMVLAASFENFSNKSKGKFLLDGDKRSETGKSPQLVDGYVGKGIKLVGEYDDISYENVGIFEANEAFSGGAWVNTVKKKTGNTQTIIGNSGSKNDFWRGWDFHLNDKNQVSVRLISALPTNYIQVTTVDSIKVNEWRHLFFTYDGTMRAEGVNIYIDGLSMKTTVEYDNLRKSIKPVEGNTLILENRPLRVGRSYRNYTGEFGIFKGVLDEIKVYKSELTPLEVLRASKVEKEPDEWIIAAHKMFQSKEVVEQKRSIRKLNGELINLVSNIPEVMVMRDMEETRATYLLERGQYDARGERVYPGTPAHVLDFPESLPQNRLGLAKWLFMEENPLTSRVAVNRYWQLIFGRGLVATVHDFGVQGALPSHPELLDWLAVEFRESGWDINRLIKLMVTSNTYKQSSVHREELKKKDPENILLARAPTYRWQAEIIRDNALASSGLLVEKVGGKSVKPYQPDSLWIELGNYSYDLLYYHQDHGENLYRRSLYTFIRRTSPPPFMTNFDMISRSFCSVKREITNTPLQALNLLNDPQFVEAARVLAERAFEEGGMEIEDKISHAFRLVTSRYPDDRELRILCDQYKREEQRLSQSRRDAAALLDVGEHPVSKDIERPKLAAMTMVANTMLNLDETYTKR